MIQYYPGPWGSMANPAVLDSILDLTLVFDAQKLWWGMGSSNKTFLLQRVLDEKCSSSLAAQTGQVNLFDLQGLALE